MDEEDTPLILLLGIVNIKCILVEKCDIKQLVCLALLEVKCILSQEKVLLFAICIHFLKKSLQQL